MGAGAKAGNANAGNANSDGGAPNGGAGAAGKTGSGGSSGGSPAEPEAGADAGGSALPRNQIAATNHGTCAIDPQGAIICWGLARIGVSGGWSVPPGSFVELTGFTDGVCAIRQDRTFTCFSEPVQNPSDFSFVPDVKVQQVAAARGVVCGIDEQDRPFCTPVTPDRALPVPAGERLSAVSVGASFACGTRRSDGSIVCWGSAGDTEACSYSPKVGQLDAPSGSFTVIASQAYSSCALRRDGALACWGAGGPGADAHAMYCNEPVNFGQSVPPQGEFRQVAVSLNHACAVQSDGAIACWGAGRTDAGCDSSDTAYDCGQSKPASGKFEQVAVGTFHSCAMRADRTVACWGWEGNGDGRTTVPSIFK
jgi:hypothetical protein